MTFCPHHSDKGERHLKRFGIGIIGLLLASPGFARLGETHLISHRQTYQACGESNSLAFDVVSPTSGTPPYPAVVMVHGGGWSGGDRSHYYGLQNNLAKLGIATISIDYRLLPKARFPTQIGDVKCAVRWLRHEADRLKVNPERIAAIGGSAGAHLVGLLGTTPGRWENIGGYQEQTSQIRCMVLHGGPYDLLYGAAELNDNIPRQKRQLLLLQQFLGDTADRSPETYMTASPLYQATKATPPTLLLHGQQDDVVPAQQTQRFAQRLNDLGTPHDTLIIPGAGHSDFGNYTLQVRDKLLGFLSQCLR